VVVGETVVVVGRAALRVAGPSSPPQATRTTQARSRKGNARRTARVSQPPVVGPV